MFRKFLYGLMFGAGFAVAVLAVFTGYMYLRFAIPFYWVGPEEVSSGDAVREVPEIKVRQRFLGSTGVTSGDFEHGSDAVLTAGPGEITGLATANGKPVADLRLRLALNGSVYSQWVVTDVRGEYRISVPYGEYRIDGYDLDHESANRVLTGLISHPGQYYGRATFLVAESEPGRGMSFRFVTPVTTHFDKRRFDAGESVTVRWDAYPGATQYRLQVAERADPDDWRSTYIFDFSDRPSVLDTEAELRSLGAALKPGYAYSVHVQALDENMRVLSETPHSFRDTDFEIAK